MPAINKKGMWFSENWAEFFFFCLLIIGFLFSLAIQSATLSYVLIILFGIMCGRFLSQRRKGFPFYLIVFGFFVGFLLGARFASMKLLILLFAVGGGVSFWLHRRGVLR